MAITTYGELKAAVKSWLDRSDLDSRIEDFIRLGQSRVYRKLRSPMNEKIVNYTDADDGFGADYIEVPNDFLEAVTLSFDGKILTRITSQAYLQKVSADDSAREPTFLARAGGRFYFYPAPQSEDPTVTLHYWYSNPYFDDDLDADDVLLNSPGLFLFSALMEAKGFLMDDERVPAWEARYQTEIGEVNEQAETSDTSGGTTSVSSAYGD